MAVTINGTTGVGVSTTPSYPVDVYVGTLGTTATGQLVGARLLGTAGSNGDVLEVSQVRGSAGSDWTTAGWRLQQRVDNTWMGYIQFNGTASGTNNNGISIGTGSSAASANSVTERLRIDATGNVSVGGTSTLGKLDVTGSVYASGSYILPNDGTFYWGSGDGSTRIQGNSTTDVMSLYTVGTERLKIDASGRVTMPAQPAFFAQHTLSTATTPSEIIWGTTQFNIGSNYSTTTGRFTAPVAGIYFFRAHTLTANATAGETRILFYKNGVSISGLGFIATKTATTWASISAQGHINLAAGDYVSVFLTAVAGSLYNDAVWNSFSGHLVG
jgi:hypothetical protein